MNIEAFNTDTLRKLVRNLQDENKKLKEKLDEANIPYEEINLFEQPINFYIINTDESTRWKCIYRFCEKYI